MLSASLLSKTRFSELARIWWNCTGRWLTWLAPATWARVLFLRSDARPVPVEGCRQRWWARVWRGVGGI